MRTCGDEKGHGVGGIQAVRYFVVRVEQCK